MSVTTWGWGSRSAAVSVMGWGACSYAEHIPSIIVEFLTNSKAYSCVVTRTYIQIKKRATGEVLLRAKPSTIPPRVISELITRSEDAISIATRRSKGWPNESNIICGDM